MTDEQWRQFQSWTTGFPNQDENGVDLSLLRANLLLTPEARIRRLQEAARSLFELDRARSARIHPNR